MKKILVIGGDFRQLVLAEEFKKSGYPVKVFGFDKSYTENSFYEVTDISDAIKESDVIIFGLPVLKDEKTINTPLYDKTVYVDEIISSLNHNTVVLGGMTSPLFKEKLKNKCFGVYDYFDREELIVKNIIPTVEGAVAIASQPAMEKAFEKVKEDHQRWSRCMCLVQVDMSFYLYQIALKMMLKN